jgi:hypothetical protein
MHVHASPINPNTPLRCSLLFVLRRKGKRSAPERSCWSPLRRWLAKLPGKPAWKTGKSKKQASRQQPQGKRKQKERSNAGDAANFIFISDWA